jgi:carboxymethylenebutenolidase
MKALHAVTAMMLIVSPLPIKAGGQTLAAPHTVVVHSGSLTLRGLLWKPEGAGPFPAVLYNHGSGPQSDLTRPAKLGPVFARHGYVILYLFRRGAGLSADQGTDAETLMNRALAEHGQAGRNEVQLQLLEAELADVLAGLAVLRERSDVDAARIAMVGYSFGGQLTLLLAERHRIRAAAVFAVAAGSWEGSPKLQHRLLEAVRRTTAPVFFIHAANDYSVAPGKVLNAEMARAGRSHRSKIYPAVGSTPRDGHDFIHQRVSSWEADVFAFLDERTRRCRAFPQRPNMIGRGIDTIGKTR